MKRKEDESARKTEKEALERVKAERDALEQRLEKEGKALDEVVQNEIASLKRDIEARDDELNRMQEELEAAEAGGEEVEDLKKQIKAKDEEIQQLEGALDESASQLLQNEDDLVALRQQLASEKQVNSSLSAQISQFSVVKAKSPLGNEVFNSDKDDVIASLEEDLEEARQEIILLHEKVASMANEDRSTELRDLEIQNLETTKADLEDRVKSLRQQVSIQFSPSQTPDKSWLLRPLPVVRTPKTPGQFLSNVSFYTSSISTGSDTDPLRSRLAFELESG
jgi:predicted RNase H-like nuclease (RuvC/YqgF family)